MTQYNGIFEYILKLQDAYDTPTPIIYEPKNEKWVLVPKFSPVTPKHNRTTKSFEDTKRILRELDNDPIFQLIESQQIEKQQEESGPILTKKLTPPKNTGNK